MTRKKTTLRLVSFWIVVVIMITSMSLTSNITYATQSHKDRFSKNYTITGIGATDILNVALAQQGKTGSDLGYTEQWCADFVCDCADLAGQGAAVPRYGECTGLKKRIIEAGGVDVGLNNAKPGDIVFFSGHVEIVYSGTGSNIVSIGGNTGNGGDLYRRRVCSPRKHGNPISVVRPNYKGSPIEAFFFDFWGVDNNITVSDTYKVWFKQIGYGKNCDVNIHIDGKEAKNALGTLYQDDNGFFSYELDTTKFSEGKHTLYAVLRNDSGKEVWVSRDIIIKQNYFFDFWGVDDGITVSDNYKIWLKQQNLGNASNSHIDLYLDVVDNENLMSTLYQDDSGFYSYNMDIIKYPTGGHTVYAVFRNTTGIEMMVTRNLVFQDESFFSFWGVDNNITISEKYKAWFKQIGFGSGNSCDVNLHIDGKEAKNALGTIYQDDSGFFSYELDTTKFSEGNHILYAVLRNTSGKEVWQSRDIIIKQNYFFDFWGVDDGVTVNNDYKIWFKQTELGNASNSDVNIYIDGKNIEDFLMTIYQDENGFFSYSLNTSNFSVGEHKIYAVFRNTSGIEIWRERNINITRLYGDADKNGEFNIADAVMLQKWLLGSSKELTCWQNVDLCEDGVIDVFDMVMLRRLLVEKKITK